MKMIALALFAPILFAQGSTGAATTKGTCSPAITGSHNTINIDVKDCGLSKERTDEFRSLFAQILEKQVAPKVLMLILDDINSGLIRIEGGVVRIENKVSEIENSQKRRELNAQQQEQFASLMSAEGPQIIEYDLRPNDDETLSLIKSVRFALTRVGIEMKSAGNMLSDPENPYPPPGVAIVYGRDRAVTAWGLYGAMNTVGLSSKMIPAEHPDLLRILFGPKPAAGK